MVENVIKFPRATRDGARRNRWNFTLSKDSEDIDERIRAAFAWAYRAIETREILVADPRRYDISYLLDAVFTGMLKEKIDGKEDYKISVEKVSNHNLKLILDEFYALWHKLYLEKTEISRIAKLQSRNESLNNVFFKFVRDEELTACGYGSIQEYIDDKDGSVTIFDTTVNALSDHNGPGWVLMIPYDKEKFAPIDIFKALVTMNSYRMGVEESLTENYDDWEYLNPAIDLFPKDRIIITRYDQGL